MGVIVLGQKARYAAGLSLAINLISDLIGVVEVVTCYLCCCNAELATKRKRGVCVCVCVCRRKQRCSTREGSYVRSQRAVLKKKKDMEGLFKLSWAL